MTGEAFTACLRLDAEGEAAASFYASIIKDSKRGRVDRYTKAGPGPARGHDCRCRTHGSEVRRP